MITIEKAMEHLSPQEKQEAERLFGIALEYVEQKDFAHAAEYYAKAAAYGHPGAQNNLGRLYENGNGISKDKKKALELYLEAAKHGSCVAMRNIANLYLNGIGTERDFDTVVEWLETAAEQKDILACKKLAEAYDRWEYKNEEKKLYWYKKAAEYGDVDSMFFLGNYYAVQGDHQDITLAAYYYDCAGKAGTPEEKLKVAKAFDLLRNEWAGFTEDKPALDLEKAKYWYNEVWACGNDDLKLEAAKGLDEKVHKGKVLRPALDMNRAYMTYRTLGMSGNKEACALAAYCSETGKGTIHNIDIAIMLYEKAGYKEDADRCRRKKEGKDDSFEENTPLVCGISPIGVEVHSHGKEYYMKDSPPLDFEVCEYDGKVYYLSYSYLTHCSYLCSSDVNGNNIRILDKLPDNVFCIHANITGIYAYNSPDFVRPYVRHYNFDGSLISECQEEYEGILNENGYPGDEYRIYDVYIYDNRCYFVYEYPLNEKSMYQIRCMYVDEGRVDLLYETAIKIERLFATDNKVIFLAKYENEDYYLSEEAWMILDLVWNTVECLSNPYCNPENILDHPEVYDSESPQYNERCDYKRNIKCFDLNRSIFWEANGSRWEAYRLWGDRNSVIKDMPVWHMEPIRALGTNREYFDGIHHYFAPYNSKFYSSDHTGKIYDWTKERDGHGKCEQFKVLGNHLYLDKAAYYEEQYPLTIEVSEPIRRSWYDKSIDDDLVEAFEKSQSQPEPEPEQKSEPETKQDLFDVFTTWFKQETEKEQKQADPGSKPDSSPSSDPFGAPRTDWDPFADPSPASDPFEASRTDWDPFADPSPSSDPFGAPPIDRDPFADPSPSSDPFGAPPIDWDPFADPSPASDPFGAPQTDWDPFADLFLASDPFGAPRTDWDPFGEDTKPAPPTKAKKTVSAGESADHDMSVEKIIGQTDIKYNICTFGAKLHIGFGVPVTIRINGNEYAAKMHNKTKGRVDGIKKLYKENGIELGDKLRALYIADERVIELEKIG